MSSVGTLQPPPVSTDMCSNGIGHADRPNEIACAGDGDVGFTTAHGSPPLSRDASVAELFRTLSERRVVLASSVEGACAELFPRAEGGMLDDKEAVSRMTALYARIYAAVDPQNEYYRRTDPDHGPAVLSWVERICADRGGASLPLRLAALFHDIERYAPSLRVPRLRDPALDETARKQVLHPLNCARIVGALLVRCGFTEEVVSHVDFLVRNHDRCNNEAISFEGIVMLEAVDVASGRSKALESDLAMLQYADSATFFSTTLRLFVRHSLDDRGENPEKLVVRIRNNMSRILREGPDALEAIQNAARAVSAGDDECLAIVDRAFESR